jgi:hypothetical protein
MDFIPNWMTSIWFFVIMGLIAAGLIGLLVFLRMKGTGEE